MKSDAGNRQVDDQASRQRVAHTPTQTVSVDVPLSNPAVQQYRQNAILTMQRTHGNAAVRRYLATVQRDEAPPAVAPPASTTGTSTTATPDATTAPKTFNTEWKIDYQVLPTGKGAAQIKQRKPDQTALYVQDLKVLPNGVTDSQHLNGVNAADSGAVSLGNLTLPDQPGNASGKIKFGGQPTLKIGVTFSQETDKKAAAKFGAEKAGIDKELKTLLSEKMEALEEDKSNSAAIQAKLQEEANTFLASKGDDSHKYQAAVTVSPDASLAKQEAFALPSATYPAPGKDGSIYNLKVVLPTSILKGNYSATESGKAGTATSDTKGSQTTASVKQTISKADKISIATGTKTAFTKAFKKAWQKGKTEADGTKSSWDLSATEGGSTEIGGKTDLDLSKIAKAVPVVGKYLGKAVNWILGGDGKLGDVTGKITVNGSSTQKTGGETTKTITKTDMETDEVSVQSSFESFTNTSVEKAVNDAIETSFTVTDSGSSTVTDSNEKTKSTTSSSEIVTYRTDAPTLEIAKQ